MNRQTLLIIGADCQWEERELLKAAKKAGCRARFLDPHQVTVRLGHAEACLFYKTQDITPLFKSSRVIFRRARGVHEKMITLALLARSFDVPFTDSVAGVMANLNKAMFMPAIRTHLIHHIETHFVNSGETIDADYWQERLPVLVKPVHGRHGEGIEIFRDKATLKKCARRITKALMVQPFLRIESEYRVFVTGNKPLGVVRKAPRAGTSIANYAAGARFFPDTLEPKLLKESVQICRQQGIDIGGVDLAQAGNQFYLLEVNRCPEFRAFSRATGLDVAAAIIDFTLQKK